MRDQEKKHYSKIVSSLPNYAESEKEILEYWQKNKIFEQTLKKTNKGKPFVFFEGPPYANGKPGIHHVLARAYKDIILRFKTMQGFYVRRKAGWDTHGLPTEMEVEQKLGVHSKKEIEEKIGIEAFVEEAKKSVFFYKDEWEQLTRRMGYWIDMDSPYVTMTNDYIESLWWVFSRIAKNGYLYKDYKVLPWCPRCGTSLSSHELAQGYKKVTDETVYVKMKLKTRNESNHDKDVYFLVWTTTPWTLPGNVAIALNEKVRYVTVEYGKELLILAKDRLSVLEGSYTIINEQSGSDFSGTEYEGLFVDKSVPYRVVLSDFVNVKEGTGILHVAPAFGSTDQQIGKENDLPTIMTVDMDGKMKTPGYAWDGVYFKEANSLITKDLKKRLLLLKAEMYEHDYPFCWRCKSALIYFAKHSWFLKTTAVKDRMIKENKKIIWHPEFIRDGRFGEWLRENVDWAISRERYWGMPLPIWSCKSCNNQLVLGSLSDLDEYGPEKYAPTKTRIFLMRHGEAKHNVKRFLPGLGKHDNGINLTEKGKLQARKSAHSLRSKKIDVIISSPLNRARETSEIVAKELGVPIKINKELHDFDVGYLAGMPIEQWNKEYPFERRMRERVSGGESLPDVRRRMMGVLRETRKEYRGKTILIVGHGDPLWIFASALSGKPESDYGTSWYPKTADVKEVALHNWPYNRNGELDLHRPFIDKVRLHCSKCESDMTRVKEVADVWFDSGTMPFAQDHYPFSLSRKKLLYPADYIAEGIDQTRGWFYTLLAVSALLEEPAAYKNVLTVGLVLDENGEKMSKSRGNIVEPSLLFEKYGADAVRWYFYTANQPWDEKLFRETDIADASRRFLNIFWNSFVYWKTYKTKFKKAKPKILINKWALARLNQVGYDVTLALEKFDVVRAARIIENFVTEDLSRWYIRRIRNAIRFGAKNEKEEISWIFGNILYEAAKISAPFIPFLVEKMRKEAGGPASSLHLEKWTKFKKPNKADLKLIESMNEARRVVSLALEVRAKAGIKVRQPLAKLEFKSRKLDIGNKELKELVKMEVNVKEIKYNSKIKNDVELDMEITPELKEEGQLRELIRQIQNERKKAGLRPSDKITFSALTDDKGATFVKKHEATLKKEAGIKEFAFSKPAQSTRLTISLKLDM